MREITSFDSGWFYRTEIPRDKEVLDSYPSSYVSAKTERMKMGALAKGHDDGSTSSEWSFDVEHSNEKWESVTLPHDYVIKGTPDEKASRAMGFLKTENAYYRKHFKLSEKHRGKRISLLFDGVSGHCHVYLNGCLITRNYSSYNPFEADISDYVSFDSDNVVAVYIDMREIEGWWYRGGGIYRHVDLVIRDKVCVDLFGTYVYPTKNDDGTWQVPTTTTVRNDSFSDAKVTVKQTIVDKLGKSQAFYTAEGIVPARDKSNIKTDGVFTDPELWDIDSPALYTLVTEVVLDGEVVDKYESRFGFRSAHFDAERGFFLNGRPVKIKGVCAHQDFGLTGLAVPDNVHKIKLEMFREMGANGFRCSHYTFSREMMDKLDELGFLVMAEIRHFDSCEENLRMVELSVKRDRNHPSIILWSTGNEENTYHIKEQGVNIQRAMAAEVKKHDPNRPVTSAVSYVTAAIFPYVDVIGINYSLHLLEDLKKKYPDKPFFSSENCAVGSSFGNYFGKHIEQGRLDARDLASDEIHPGRADTWKFINERDWMSGGFQWTAVEHRGEAVWPRLCSVSGAIDMFLGRKDAFYQNKSLWCDEPMIHLLPHWTHHGLEGREINVWAYTNCPEAELFLNGKSLGRVEVARYGHAEWNVAYEAGELKAVGYKDGVAVAEIVHRTAKEPHALVLTPICDRICDGTNEMALFTCSVIDKDGNPVPDATPLVRFEADNDALVVATGSANFDHTPPSHFERKMYAGRATVGVRSARIGKATLFAYAEGLRTATCDFEVIKK